MRLPTALILASVCSYAQEHHYEVASIKPVGTTPGPTMISGGVNDGGRLTTKGTSVGTLVNFAYRVQSYQVVGAPGWFGSERFDIEAKPETPFKPTAEETQAMLRQLLAERFGLKVRRETREGNVYNLVVAKGGVKMKRNDGPPEQLGTQLPPKPGQSAPMPRGMVRMGFGVMMARGTKLGALTQYLTADLGRPVYDMTGLTGQYDLELHWTPEQFPANLPADYPFERPDPNGPTIFTALEEQLGLKLESAKGPVETLVIEAVEKPKEN